MSVETPTTATTSTVTNFNKKDLLINTWALAPTASVADIDAAYGARVDISTTYIRRIIDYQIRTGYLDDDEIAQTLNPRLQHRLMDILRTDFDDLEVTLTVPSRNSVSHFLESRNITKKTALINLKFLHQDMTAVAAADIIGCSETHARNVFHDIREEYELVWMGDRIDEELTQFLENTAIPQYHRTNP